MVTDQIFSSPWNVHNF